MLQPNRTARQPARKHSGPRRPSAKPVKKHGAPSSAPTSSPLTPKSLKPVFARAISGPHQLWLVILGSLVAEIVTAISAFLTCRSSGCSNQIVQSMAQLSLYLPLSQNLLWGTFALLVLIAAFPLGSPRWMSLAFRWFITYQRKVLDNPKVMIILPALVVAIAALEILSHGSKVGPKVVIIALILSGLTFYKIYNEYRELLQKKIAAISARKELVASFLRFRWRLHLVSLGCARVITLVGWLLISANLGDVLAEGPAPLASVLVSTSKKYSLLWWMIAFWGISGALIVGLRPPHRIAGFLNESFCPRCNRFLFLPILGGESYCPSCKIGEFPGVFGVGGNRGRKLRDNRETKRKRQQKERSASENAGAKVRKK